MNSQNNTQERTIASNIAKDIKRVILDCLKEHRKNNPTLKIGLSNAGNRHAQNLLKEIVVVERVPKKEEDFSDFVIDNPKKRKLAETSVLEEESEKGDAESEEGFLEISQNLVIEDANDDDGSFEENKSEDDEPELQPQKETETISKVIWHSWTRPPPMPRGRGKILDFQTKMELEHDLKIEKLEKADEDYFPSQDSSQSDVSEVKIIEKKKTLTRTIPSKKTVTKNSKKTRRYYSPPMKKSNNNNNNPKDKSDYDDNDDFQPCNFVKRSSNFVAENRKRKK